MSIKTYIDRASYAVSLAAIAAVLTLAFSGNLKISYHASIGNDELASSDDVHMGRIQLAEAMPTAAIPQRKPRVPK